MTNDFFFGFLISIPFYAIVLFLFRDIIISRFIAHALVTKVEKNEGPVALPFDREQFTEDLVNDILVSYRLLLILLNEFNFILQQTAENSETYVIVKAKIKYMKETIKDTEEFLDKLNNNEYKDIQKEVQELVDSCIIR